MSSNNHTIVAKKITNELINIISGRNEKSLFGNKPSSVAMLGMLKGQTEDRMFDDDEYSIKNIPSLGLSFHAPIDSKKITIQLKGYLYYRIKPTFDEQSRYMIDLFSDKYNIDFKNIDELNDYFEERKKGFGKDLLDHTIDYLKNIGMRELTCTISKKNFKSQALHGKCGFIPTNDAPLNCWGELEEGTILYRLDT